MAGYMWRNAKTDLKTDRLIEILNEHFRRVTHLFGGFIKIDAGYRISQFIELPLLTAEPDAPSSGVRLFSIQNGGGKVELRARFPTGATQVISTEP